MGLEGNIEVNRSLETAKRSFAESRSFEGTLVSVPALGDRAPARRHASWLSRDVTIPPEVRRELEVAPAGDLRKQLRRTLTGKVMITSTIVVTVVGIATFLL